MNMNREQQVAIADFSMSSSLQMKWKSQLAAIQRQHDKTLDVVCRLHDELDEAESKARELLATETRLKALLSKGK